MTNNKKIALLKLSLFLILVAFSIYSIKFGGEIWGGVIALGILVILSLILSEGELINPLTWFPPVFFLYSSSYAILMAMEEVPYKDNIQEVLYIQWVALFVFVIIQSLFRKTKYQVNQEILANIKPVAFPLYCISLILTSIYILYVLSSGLSSKYAISLDSSIFKNLVPFFSILIITFIILVTYEIINKKKMPKLFVVLTLLYGFFALLVLGERDYLLKMTIGVFFLYHVLIKRISFNKLFLIGALFIVSIPFLDRFKNAAFEEGGRIVRNENFIIQLLSGEFITAGRNLSTLISGENILWDKFYGETFIWDLEVLFLSGTSPGSWFNQLFFPDLVSRGGGNGFTLVGEGYMNFDIWGVILVFILLSLILRILYNLATKSGIWLVIYIITIPLIVYSIRGDLATLFTQFGKQILLPIFIIFITKAFLQRIPKRRRL